MGYAANSIKTVEKWNQEALRVEESWPAGKHFKLKKMLSIALADLRTTAQATSRAVAVIETGAPNEDIVQNHLTQHC